MTDELALVYYLARKYRTLAAAERPYFTVQKLIHDVDTCELSAFRLLAPHEHGKAYIVVLGMPPPTALHQTLTGLLADGEAVTLPVDLLLALLDRHVTQVMTHDGWSEHHYQPPTNGHKKHRG